MIGYVTLGTNDSPAPLFYDALLGEIGGKRLMESERSSLVGGADRPGLGVIKPFDESRDPRQRHDGRAPVDSEEKVKASYDKALKLGAKDEGPPGLRGGTFYAAYFRDLDGNKLNVFHFPH